MKLSARKSGRNLPEWEHKQFHSPLRSHPVATEKSPSKLTGMSKNATENVWIDPGPCTPTLVGALSPSHLIVSKLG